MVFVTPEQYFEIQNKAGEGRGSSLEDLRRMAKNKGKCIVCGQPVWKLGDCDMCFPCTTGESDDSDDYELIG